METSERARLRALCEALEVGPATGPQPTRQDLAEALGDALLMFMDTVGHLTRERDEARADLAHALRVVQGFADGAAMPEARDAARAMLDAIRARVGV